MKSWVNFVANNSLLFILLTFIVISAFALFLRNLNVEAFPDPSPPVIEIVSLYPGRSAEEVERQITVPLEIALAGMRGLHRINSISLYGLSDIKCTFSYDIPYKEARQEVINRLSTVSLPDGVSPQIIPNPIGEVMRYVVVGNRDLMELRTLQDWVISRYIKTAEGVEDVPSYGGFIKAYVVEIKPENLLKYKVSLSDVVQAITNSNINVGGRAIDFGSQYFLIRGVGLIRNIKDIEQIVVAYHNGVPVLIKDLGEVRIGNIPRTGIVGLNNKDDIVMGVVVLRRDAKSIPSIRSIREKIEELNSYILPKDVKVIPFYERGKLIDTVIHKVSEIALVGIVLVFASIFLFLGDLRVALLVALTVPMSLVVALGVMAIKGESANFLSIAAIDFGIIADIPLLFVENYLRNTRQLGVRRAIVQSSQEVGRLLVFSVVLIGISFLPVFLMEGAEKRIFAPMVRTYLYAISAVVILTFTFVVALLVSAIKSAKEKTLVVRILEDIYDKLLNKLLNLRLKYTVILLSSLALLSLFVIKSLGLEFIPKMDEGNIYMRIIFPYSISLSQTYENAKKVRDFLMEFPEIKTVEFQVGRPEDGTDPTGPFNSEYFIDLKPYSQWKRFGSKEELEEAIRVGVKSMFPKVDINISQYIQDNLEEVMTGVKGENAVKVFGDDLYKLDTIADQIKERITKVKGIEDVGIFREIGQPNLVIEADREKLSAYGLSVQQLMDTVSAAMGGKEATQVIEGDKRFSLLVILPDELRQNVSKIGDIPVLLPNGSYVKLSSVANIKFSTGASFIYRENYKRYIPIKFSVVSKDLAGAVRKAQESVKDIQLPEGYFIEWSGQFKSLVEGLRRFAFSGTLALFSLSVFLYIINRSVRNTLIAMSGILFALFGGSVSLLIAGFPMSLSAIVGFVSILGISVLNISFMLRAYKKHILDGLSSVESAKRSAKENFRAVLLSSFTASMGLLPTALAKGVGSQIQKPLAVVVVGGMLLSGLLILLVVPSLLRYAHVEER
ncbi:efflux RND transporter permease subunit [Hydrogenobacter hydrogenophilus]|uniref:Cobalt-zinc-cadmium resistance protein CzcA n=1 Tax=Hydrogenobacter hydrogenophilus TaxID=35835 RepID=A0A285P279_9AQUI|nr:CusA/CzcA family heavy metal efflux RND transporter [Hydrogenobacter hydrogenophilus]SNZ13981.1 cobalt-zinc-cadmium resistance protein CzcA [Hydrogenobacter hydrogenophilus]